jgi:hypothetical protein
MEQVETQKDPQPPKPPQDPKHLVAIEVDGTQRQVEKGKYVVSELKALLGIAPEYELDQVEGGRFEALADDATIHIKGEEIFVSHVRRGGSS